MSAESVIHPLAATLVDGRAYPDVAPSGVALPFIVYQQVGGESAVYINNTLADKENGRFQIACWSKTRLQAITLAKQVEDALMASAAITCRPLGARIATHEPDTNLYGCRQDFSVWSIR